MLKRAIDTAYLALVAMECSSVPLVKSWRLNERHYGALQGMNKDEAAHRYGAAQVATWRRGFAARPPALENRDGGPAAESLADTLERVLVYWRETLKPELASGTNLLVVAHGNSLRALVKHVERIDDKAVEQLDVPTGVPLLYTCDASGKPVSAHRRLDFGP